jgi:DNA-binding MarR family transcriptional regulator
MTLAPRSISKPRLQRPAVASKQRLRLWLSLLRTTRRVEADIRERLRVKFDTTLPQFDVMAALFKYERGLTMTALSRTLIVSNGNVTGIVDRLVADGLVVRMADQSDRRTTFVRLTAKGTRDFRHMANAHEGWINELLGGLTSEDASAIMLPLTKHERVQRTTEA